MELREKWEMDRNSEIGQAKKEGIEEGEAKGKAEGILERNIEIAKNMLNKKFKEEDIIDVTGLTKEEIEKLKKEI